MSNKPCKDCGIVPTVAVELCRSCYSRHHHAGTLPRRLTTHERFQRKCVPQPNGCIYFGPAIKDHKYGSFKYGEKTLKAHQYAWLMQRGEIPAGAYILHRCDNPPCVNVDHLRLGTHVENMQDAVDRQRWPRKLTATQVEAIRALKGVMTQKDIAAQFGVRDSQISRIFSGKRRSGKIQKLGPNS